MAPAAAQQAAAAAARTGQLFPHQLAQEQEAAAKATNAGLERTMRADIGVSAQHPELTGKPFAQIDPGLDRANSGLGLGLAMVGQLVSMHGGAVRVDSEGLGRGATFTVRLPRGPSASCTRPHAHGAQPHAPAAEPLVR